MADTFRRESEILKKFVDDSPDVSEMDVDQIIQMYYQVISVSSIIKVLQPQVNEKETLQKMHDVEEYIEKKFNAKIHPAITRHLSENIQKSMNRLKDNQEKTREQRQKDATSFESLRQMMSTREFVDQYDRQIK